MRDLGQRDPTRARALLDNTRLVAEKRDETMLWRAWAKAATNLMVHLGEQNLTAARALLADVRVVAEQRDESPL